MSVGEKLFQAVCRSVSGVKTATEFDITKTGVFFGGKSDDEVVIYALTDWLQESVAVDNLVVLTGRDMRLQVIHFNEDDDKSYPWITTIEGVYGREQAQWRGLGNWFGEWLVKVIGYNNILHERRSPEFSWEAP